jgi:hypothetical protein
MHTEPGRDDRVPLPSAVGPRREHRGIGGPLAIICALVAFAIALEVFFD